jgi:hypothetical protein
VSEEKPVAFEGWCILELMGHRRLGGYVTEAVIAGAGLIRIDVPGLRPGETAATQFYSPSALYCITPTTEAIARALAAKAQPEPVQRWELPASPARDIQTVAPNDQFEDEEDQDDDGEDDEEDEEDAEL